MLCADIAMFDYSKGSITVEEIRMQISGKSTVGFELVSEGNNVYSTFNPELNVPNPWQFVEATLEEVEKATQLATQAFTVYSELDGNDRSNFLLSIAALLKKNETVLKDTFCLESGLSSARAITELNRTIWQLELFAKIAKDNSWRQIVIDTSNPNRKPAPKPDLRKMNIAIGPIAVFGSSNFPFAYSTIGGDTASALAVGCPVIVKSHPMHAGTGELVARIVIEAAQKTGMPEGVFSNLNAAGYTIGQQLVQHPAIKAVGFTGSISGGRVLFDLANQRKEPIPFFAEMGSTNPIIFLDDAFENDNLQHWVEKYTDSLLKDAGQFCTNPGLIIGLDTPYFHSFIEKVAKTIANQPSNCMLHPTIHKNYNRGKANAEKQNFVSILTTVETQKSNYAAQTILKTDAINFISNPELHHEVFGPFALAVVCQSVEGITEIITKLEGQLTGTLVGSNTTIEKNKVLVATLRNRVGRLILNGVPTGVEVCGAMQHGGPYPASTDSRFGAVGTHSVNRWTRPISYQNWPNSLLPIELKNENPLIVWREINGQFTQESL